MHTEFAKHSSTLLMSCKYTEFDQAKLLVILAQYTRVGTVFAVERIKLCQMQCFCVLKNALFQLCVFEVVYYQFLYGDISSIPIV